MLRASCAIIAIAAAASCGQADSADVSRSTPTSARSVPEPDTCNGSTLDYTKSFESIENLVDGSDEVFIGTVVGEVDAPESGPEDDRRQLRTTVVEVEQKFKGQSRSRVEVEMSDWRVDSDGNKVPGVGCPWIEDGDRVMLAVTVFGDRRGASSSESAYTLGGGEVGDTQRRATLARQIERMTESELVDALNEASN